MSSFGCWWNKNQRQGPTSTLRWVIGRVCARARSPALFPCQDVWFDSISTDDTRSLSQSGGGLRVSRVPPAQSCHHSKAWNGASAGQSGSKLVVQVLKADSDGVLCAGSPMVIQ